MITYDNPYFSEKVFSLGGLTGARNKNLRQTYDTFRYFFKKRDLKINRNMIFSMQSSKQFHVLLLISIVR